MSRTFGDSGDRSGRGSRPVVPDVRPRGLSLPEAGRTRPSGPPVPESFREHSVARLSDIRGRDHTGRREQRRDASGQSRADREDAVLEMLGTYRVISRRALVEVGFDGHPFAASRTMASLERRGLVDHSLVARGNRGYQVLFLTGAGRDAVARRKARRAADREEDDAGQRYWAGPGDLRALRHDHHVFEAVLADTAGERGSGGRIRRVRLESELRGLLAAAGDAGARSGGPVAADRERRRQAEAVGLRVFEQGVPLPDAIVELEMPDGRMEVRAIEVATSSYTHVQVRSKTLAGFRVYNTPAPGDRRPRAIRDPGREFPLSWGGR